MFQPRYRYAYDPGAICTLAAVRFVMSLHGRPVAPDAEEPQKLAQTQIADMALRYVVITQ